MTDTGRPTPRAITFVIDVADGEDYDSVRDRIAKGEGDLYDDTPATWAEGSTP